MVDPSSGPEVAPAVADGDAAEVQGLLVVVKRHRMTSLKPENKSKIFLESLKLRKFQTVKQIKRGKLLALAVADGDATEVQGTA